MAGPELANAITESLLFWTVIFYLAFLFHSWRIKEFDDDVKSIEILFLSGALGYVFQNLSAYFSPIIDIPKWLEYLKSLNPLGPSFMFNLYIGLIFILIYYLIFVLFAFFILTIIQFCIDPNKQILYKYYRFEILKKYKITKIFGLRIPLILFSIGGISFIIGAIMSLLLSIKFISLDFLVINIFIITDICSNISINSFDCLVWNSKFHYKKYFCRTYSYDFG